MTTWPMPLHPERIAIAGDWHGNIPVALAQITRAQEAGADVLVHCGDFGYWKPGPSTDRYLSRIERLLASFELALAWVDGNHEAHDRLLNQPIDPDTGLRSVTSHVWHLPRGFRWRFGEHTWMALGGAHSVDRNWRVEGRDWWPQEFLSDAEIAYASRPGPVDVMVCHDAPDTVDIPAIRGHSSWPQGDLARSAAHRKLIGDVVRSIRPSVLWHGHYHDRYADDMKLDDATSVHVEGLADDTTDWRDNLVLVGSSGWLSSTQPGEIAK